MTQAHNNAIVFSPYQVVESRLLNDHRALMGLGDVTKTSTIIASGAGATASVLAAALPGTALYASLIAIGVSAQAIPVIGTIAGALAIAAGLIAKSFGKAKAIKGSRLEIQDQNVELYNLNTDLDNQLIEIGTQTANIKAQLKANGLDGIGDFLKKVFTPGKVEKEKLADVQKENERITAEVNSKIASLKSLQDELQSTYDRLTKVKSTKNIILWSGAAIAVAGIGYLVYDYFTDKK